MAAADWRRVWRRVGCRAVPPSTQRHCEYHPRQTRRAVDGAAAASNGRSLRAHGGKLAEIRLRCAHSGFWLRRPDSQAAHGGPSQLPRRAPWPAASIKFRAGPWVLLGRLRPKWAGPEEPGAPSPRASAWLERRNVEMRGTTNNRQAILCTRRFQLTDQISGWAQKGSLLPKMGSAGCSMFDSM